MRLLRQFGRWCAAVQLLPALESGEETLVGGQAVMEGVMMRTPHAWGIAVRKAEGGLVTHSEPLDRPSEKRPWLAWPLVRGLATLGQAMSLGFRALRFSANTALADVQEADARPGARKLEFSGWLVAGNLIFSIGFFIVAYKYLPLLAATEVQRALVNASSASAAASFASGLLAHSFFFSLLDGAFRMAIFLLVIWGMSRWKDIHRIFEYHGAEHKTVFAFESGAPVDIAAAQKYSTYHPRCGTSFLMTIMLISIFVYSLVPVTSFGARMAMRIALLPLIAAMAYEMIRFAARLLRRREQGAKLGMRSWCFLLLTRPGMWLQRITTQPPADGQVECAIRALDEAMLLEKQRGGELVIA